MRNITIRTALVALILLLAQTAFAQVVNVRGTVLDQQGKPLAGATVQLLNPDTGRKYEMKTNQRGEYQQVGILLGNYSVAVIVNGEKVFSQDKIFNPTQQDSVLDIDLSKVGGGIPGGAPPTGAPKVSEEQKKEIAKVEEENKKIRSLNQMLKDADAAKAAGNLDQAISIMQQATSMAPDKELLWIRMADYTMAAQKWPDAIVAQEKAIALITAQPPEKQNKQALAALYNNLGQAYAKSGKPKEALAQYTKAAEVNPAGAAMYYFNLGAVLTNTGHVDEANTAFDKAIAADPNYADAYYQKGVNLLGKGKVEPKTGKVVYPEEAPAALNKYLELQPQGKYAQSAKEIIASMGEEVQTRYKAGKKK